MIIYLISNSVNNKEYVGQTRTSLDTRWKQHLTYNNDKTTRIINNAIHKHGSDKFTIKEIDTASSLDELDKKEIYWTKKLNTLAPNGYNLLLGNSKGIPAGPEFNKRIRNGLKYKRIPIVEINPTTGKFVKNWTGICTAARCYKASIRNIFKSCRSDGARTVKGRSFIYKSDYDETKSYAIFGYNPTGLGNRFHPVYSVDRDGKIEEFSSVREAADASGVNQSTLSGHLSRKTHTCNGKIWFYSNPNGGC